MIDTNSQKEIQRAGREAFAIASRPRSILDRLFGLKSQTTITDIIERGSVPITVEAEIIDNSMLLEALLLEAADQLRINPYTTLTYQMLKDVQNGLTIKSGAKLLESLDADWVPPGLSDAIQLYDWLHQETLPPDFRCQFVNFFVELDELEPIVAGLSQSRWERLRTWSCNRV